MRGGTPRQVLFNPGRARKKNRRRANFRGLSRAHELALAWHLLFSRKPVKRVRVRERGRASCVSARTRWRRAAERRYGTACPRTEDRCEAAAVNLGPDAENS